VPNANLPNNTCANNKKMQSSKKCFTKESL
jgi:hypothetical protein